MKDRFGDLLLEVRKAMEQTDSIRRRDALETFGVDVQRAWNELQAKLKAMACK